MLLTSVHMCLPQWSVFWNEWKKSELCSISATTPHFLLCQQFSIVTDVHGKTNAFGKITGDGCQPVAVKEGFDSWCCAPAILHQQFLAILTEEVRNVNTVSLCCSLMSQNSKNPSCRRVFTPDVSLPTPHPSPAPFCGLWIAAPACFSCCD